MSQTKKESFFEGSAAARLAKWILSEHQRPDTARRGGARPEKGCEVKVKKDSFLEGTVTGKALA